MLKNLQFLARHYFIPHHTNNYKAKALHHHSLIFYIIFLLLFQTFYLFAKKIDPNILGYATDITVEKILYLVNLERQKANLEPLALSTNLSQAAEK